MPGEQKTELSPERVAAYRRAEKQGDCVEVWSPDLRVLLEAYGESVTRAAEVELLRGYAWAIDMIEGLVDKSDEDAPGPIELDPPWRLDMFVGEDADTIPVEGRTLLELLLSYHERIGPAPGDPADDLDKVRAKLRALIADRQAKAEAAGEAWLAEMRARQGQST
jgi:hypothetical protein